MATLTGWTGSILKVDLSRGETSVIDTCDYVPAYVGGMGVAARIAWDTLTPGIDAFDPENPLFLMLGPLTGTLASGGGRVLVAGISPQLSPSVFSRSSMGGHWGAELKYAGYDGMMVVGKADKPVYLWIHDGEVEICDASDLWGTGTYGTTAILRARYGPKTRVAAIGQAGERLSRIACIQTETGNAAGQGGYGGVMGAKQLKAIAVRGTLGVRLADPRRFLEVCLAGSAGELGRGGRPPEEGLRARRHACGFCNAECGNALYMNVPGEATGGLYSASRQCFGFMTQTTRSQVETRAINADYGLNGWEIAYGIIPWLQICRQHGLIDRVDGIEIPVPDNPVLNLRDAARVSADFMTALLRMIALREGELGDALSEGACYAAERLFGGEGAPFLDRIYPRRMGQTNHWNGHWGTGGNIYFPFWLVPVLQWCVDTRDPASDSTHPYTGNFLRFVPEHGPNRGPLTMEQARASCAVVYGHPDACDPTLAYEVPDAKAIPAIFHHDLGMLVESLVLCERQHAHVFRHDAPESPADTGLIGRLFSASTGFEMDAQDMRRAGERVFSLLRAIDVRNHGRDRSVDWRAAETLTQPAFSDGVVLDLDRFAPMLDRYYELRGWNPANGWPTRARLKALELGDVADELAALGRLG